jgi:hypothetical protein
MKDATTMVSKPTKSRKEIASLIVELVNAQSPEQIEGVDIISVYDPIGNWGPGLIWPPVIKGGITEGIILDVVADLHRQFDISD